MQQAQALGTRIVVHARERLVEGDQARRVRAARARVVRGGRGEQRHGYREDPFTAGGRAGGRDPAAVLVPLDPEFVPGAVVERGGEVFEPAAGGVVRLLPGDLRLEELTHRRPVLRGPGVGGLAQPLAGRGEPGGGLAGGPPDQPQFHAGGRGTVLQLGVHVAHLSFGGPDEFLEGARDLGDQVRFEDFPFMGRQDAGELADLGTERLGEFGYGMLAALVDDVDDHAVLHHPGGGGVPVPGQGVLQGLEFLAQPTLYALPGTLRVVGRRQPGLDGAGQRDRRGGRPGAVARGRHREVRQGDRDQAGGGEPLEPRDGLRTRRGRFREALLQLLDAAFGLARLPVRLGVARAGEPLIRLARAQGFGGLGEPSLKFRDGRADGGAQRGVALVRCRRLAPGLFGAQGEFGGPFSRPPGLGAFLLRLAGRLAPFAQGRPQGGQGHGEGAMGAAYLGKARPVGGQAQFAGGPGEFGGGPFGPPGRLQEVGGALLAPQASPAHRLGGGGHLGVRPGEGALVGYVGQLGVEGASACGHLLGLCGDRFRLLPEQVEFRVQGGDTGPPRRLPRPLAHVLGGGLGPAAGEGADAEPPVRPRPGPGSAVPSRSDGGEQPCHRVLAHRRGLHVAAVHGRAQQGAERGPGHRPGRRGEEYVVPVGGEGGAVGKHPRVQQSGGFQCRLQSGALLLREAVVEIHQPPQRCAGKPLPQAGCAGGRGLRASSAAGLQRGELLADTAGAYRQLRRPAYGFGRPVGQARRGGAVGSCRVCASRVGPVEVPRPLLEFIEQAGHVGAGQLGPGAGAFPYVVQQGLPRPYGVLLRPALRRGGLVEVGVRLVEADGCLALGLGRALGPLREVLRVGERTMPAVRRLLGRAPQFGLGQPLLPGQVDPCGTGRLPRLAESVLGQPAGGRVCRPAA